jgi:uncharacterized protein YndB with AHSA1/START domain
MRNQNQKVEGAMDDREVIVTREFNAPRELVWDAWSDPAQLKAWHAPHGCEIRFKRFEFREGGGFHSCIYNPTFGECWCVGTYLEIRRPEKIVYQMATADSEGRIVAPASVGHDADWPTETIVTVTFEEREGKTMLRLHQTVSELLAKRTGAYPSWLQMLGRLNEQLVVPLQTPLVVGKA